MLMRYKAVQASALLAFRSQIQVVGLGLVR